ncbi:non-homologous end-joining DNA ligase [Candidatus Palauibacter sp.]|uniref:non-homologous end-joining DNA ligase n=1 Tax=Candidatus Palauibacter sp. TaxID=3101350 RepID=UPI003B0153ED
MPRGRLEEYREKRASERTPEPFGGAPGTGVGVFVVQLHAATRRHYDLRLEIGGVLVSWAVPKGISADPADRKLAVHVEDHPVEYIEFEGVIPAGEYGGGEMIVWDIGRCIMLEDPEEGLEKGKLLFELRGHKLKGVWTLVRLEKGETGKEWLLIRERRGGHPILEDGSLPESSILSGLTVEQMGERERGWYPGEEVAAGLEETRAAERTVDPSEVRFMLAQPREEAFDDPAWHFELKLDGYRMLASAVEGEASLLTRNGHDALPTFPDIARALRKLPFRRFILDGEVVVHDAAGYPSFRHLQKRARLSRPHDIRQASFVAPASFYAFDLLAFDDRDLRDLSLSERRRFLRDVVPEAGPICFSEHFEGCGEALFRQVQEMGLEGIMAKRADSRYIGGRSADWRKIHAAREARFVIVGFTSPAGSRTGFGALHLGAYGPAESALPADATASAGAVSGTAAGEDGLALHYVGRVGTGFDDNTLIELRTRLDDLTSDGPAFATPAPAGDDHTWVEPELVAEIRYKEITEGGLLRHPVFLGLLPVPGETAGDADGNDGREDGTEYVLPTDCRLPRDPRAALTDPVRVDTSPPPVEELSLSNLDKVFWPEERYTKGDLITYYRDIAPWLLKFLEDRPLVLTRYPDGIDGKSFFQKNAPGFQPEWVRTEAIWSEGSERDIHYFIADDPAVLVFVANLGAIPLHVWASRVGSLDRPDWCLLDLDPKHKRDGEEVYAPFGDVVEVARTIGALCGEIGLPSYPKTSGSSGIHVMIPLGGQLDYEQSRQLAQLLATTVAAEIPDRATIIRNPSGRDGKVYIDYVQNGRGRLVVAPYSVRPRAGATVSAPLRWAEVGEELSMEDFTIRTMPERARALEPDPLLGVLSDEPDLMAALDALQRRLAG